MNPRPPLKPFSFSHAAKPKPISAIKNPSRNQQAKRGETAKTPTSSSDSKPAAEDRESTLFDEPALETGKARIAGVDHDGPAATDVGNPVCDSGSVESNAGPDESEVHYAPTAVTNAAITETSIDSAEKKEVTTPTGEVDTVAPPAMTVFKLALKREVIEAEQRAKNAPIEADNRIVTSAISNPITTNTTGEAGEHLAGTEPTQTKVTEQPEKEPTLSPDDSPILEAVTVPVRPKAPRKQTKAATGTKAAPTTAAKVNANAMGKPTPRPVPPNPAKRFSALDAAAKVLTGSAPLNASELIETMRIKGLWVSPHGRTPQATLHSAIMREIRVKGVASRFEKVGRGRFARRKTT